MSQPLGIVGLRKRYGDVMLVQKSCSLVPGSPSLAAENIYSMLLHKTDDTI